MRHALTVVITTSLLLGVVAPLPVLADKTEKSTHQQQSIGPYKGLRERPKNPFLQASDKQFRPVAEFILQKNKFTSKGMTLDCSEAIFVGVTADMVADMLGDVVENMRHHQDDCVHALPNDIKPIADAAGIQTRHGAFEFYDKILDPRVYARAKKLIKTKP